MLASTAGSTFIAPSVSRFEILFKKLDALGIRKSAIIGTLSSFLIGTLEFAIEMIIHMVSGNPIDIADSIIKYGSQIVGFLGIGWLLGDSIGVLGENAQKKKDPFFVPPVTGGLNYALAAKAGFAVGVFVAVTLLMLFADNFTFGMGSAFVLPAIMEYVMLSFNMASASSKVGLFFDDRLSGQSILGYIRNKYKEETINVDQKSYFERKWTTAGVVFAIGVAILVFALVGFGVFCPPFGFGVVGGALVVAPWIAGLGAAATVISTLGTLANIAGILKDKYPEIKEAVSIKAENCLKLLAHQYTKTLMAVQQVMAPCFCFLAKQVFSRLDLKSVIKLPYTTSTLFKEKHKEDCLTATHPAAKTA